MHTAVQIVKTNPSHLTKKPEQMCIQKKLIMNGSQTMSNFTEFPLYWHFVNYLYTFSSASNLGTKSLMTRSKELFFHSVATIFAC